MILIEVFNPNSAVPTNDFDYSNSSFDSSGQIGVPFITWKEYESPDNAGVKKTRGEFMLTKSKVMATSLSIDSRIKFEGRMFVVMKVNPVVNQIYDITIEEILDSVGTVTYE